MEIMLIPPIAASSEAQCSL